MGSDRPIDRVLGALEGVEQHNGYYKALCPAHEDHHPSLDIREAEENGQKKVLIICRAGCDTAAVLGKLGLEFKDLFSSNGAKSSNRARTPGRIVATYDYTDAAGNLLHQTVRYVPKRFSQRRPDGNGGWERNLKGVEPVLYRLQDVLEARLKGETIYVLEGEKDVDHARKELGITATTCAMGAEKWRDSYTYTLAGANVILVPDNDGAGRKHVLEVVESLLGVAACLKVLDLPDLPEKGDLSDWIEAGGAREEFDSLASEAPQFFLPTIESGFGEKEFLPVKSLREVVAEAEETPDFIVKELLKKGELTDLSGLAKYSGKTTLVMHMLKAVRDGDLFLGEPTI